MKLFDETLYTFDLKIVLKYLLRKRNIKCLHIKEINSDSDFYKRYVLTCKDLTNDKNLFIEVYEKKRS